MPLPSVAGAGILRPAFDLYRGSYKHGPRRSLGLRVVTRQRACGSPGLLRADDGIRTRDPNLGKVVLYQLSHVRVRPVRLAEVLCTVSGLTSRPRCKERGGPG